RYFAGTFDRGVFMSTDHGLSWEPENTGLADSNVTALLLDNLGYIYAGTDGGLFKSDRVVTAIRENKPVASSFRLFQNYPNPFNPTTAISYQLSAVSNVTLKVYDVLGREVATLVNQIQRPGSYEVRFDGSKLASGVYFCQIRAGDYVSVKKMVMCK
ncbi:MAG: T9SS type A sorting domain-containing protein, partial [Bacteroidetes bacterium]|nr:T9SS type A sorting domain-containing protein [Bacteroidota bacterium]